MQKMYVPKIVFAFSDKMQQRNDECDYKKFKRSIKL